MSFWKPGDKPPAVDAASRPSSGAVRSGQSQSAPPAPLSTPASSSETKLSKSVMSMKFMARKRAIEQEAAQRDSVDSSPAMIERDLSSQTTAPIISSSGIRILKVINNEYRSLPGRRSFGGFNPAVERNYAKLTGLHMLNSSGAGEGAGIDDEAMLERYETLIGLPRGPNQGRFVPKPKKSKHER